MMPNISIPAHITHGITVGKKKTFKRVITDIICSQDMTRTLWRVARQDSVAHSQRLEPKEPSSMRCLMSSSQISISGI